MNFRKSVSPILVGVLVIFGCNQRKTETVTLDVEQYRKEIEVWHQKRVEDLKGPDGWLNLVGLFWLKEGINTFGSDQANDIVFPEGKIPARAGMFLLKQSSVTLQTSPGVEIAVEKIPVTSAIVFESDSLKKGKVQEYGSLQWFIIRRDNKYGVRLRDFKSPGIETFTRIERYPVDPAWRLQARYEKATDPLRKVDITNVLGQTIAQSSPGTFVFTIDGNEYRIDVVDYGGKDYMLIVGDPTNAKETYGAGRYLYVDKPESEGPVILDFNKIYNPPCAFTSFATCPLPPKQNILDIPITAGEKNYSNAH